jgi:hypothetical protein
MSGETLVRSLRETWAIVTGIGRPAALMGGFALSAHLHPRNTRDLDFLIGIDGTEPETLLHELQPRGYRPLREPALVTVGTDRFFQFYYAPPGSFSDIKVDMLLAESCFHREALDRRQEYEWPELNLAADVVTCEDLILMKLCAGRVIDDADVVALILANRALLDYKYLRRWLSQIARVGRWNQCWRRAFPGEPDPTESS